MVNLEIKSTFSTISPHPPTILIITSHGVLWLLKEHTHKVNKKKERKKTVELWV